MPHRDYSGMQNPQQSRDRLWIAALLFTIGIYSVVFSAATCWKHYCFNSYAWDLGMFDQILHDSVFEGRPFYYTLNLFMNPSGHYFAIHFTPIIMLLFPLYRVCLLYTSDAADE